ncbi:TorD/DmsD family molecular chaperone [Thauera aromatica]|uniref:TorD/DmsD family molecular chaperone n=1 Tax=Thauera aromatica TaxID=59405 RepID=UPI001FFDC70B|nr:molecular chaperone TorD family protein [Thauera aromatica]MCK2096490.1 molecular chaperone TorD family protein [Thauera aromatica]
MNAVTELQPPPGLSAEDCARAEHYAVLARIFHAAPDAALLAGLAQAGRTLGAAEGALPSAWAALGGAAQARSPQAVHDEFDALFVSVGKPRVIANGSWYLSGFLQEAPLAALRADLAELGLARRQGVAETEDHVAALAEVMRHLVVSGPDAAGLARQRRFFCRHLAPWYARLAQALTQAPEADFYAKAGGLLQAFLDVERAAFELLEAPA